MQNSGVNYVISSLTQRLNEMDGSRLLSGSHHLNTWLCAVYVGEHSRNNPQSPYQKSFDECYPIIRAICDSKPKDKTELIANVAAAIKINLN